MKDWVVLSIGNTHTQVALASGGALGVVERLLTTDFIQAGAQAGTLTKHPKLPVFVGCVVPHAGACLREQWPKRPLTFLEYRQIRDLHFDRVDPSTIGADRLANAVAALELTGAPAIVLDCGTALNTVAIDGERQFRGGAIMPGRHMLRLALHEHTAQLPEIPIQDECPAAIGSSTGDAIRAGTDLGILGAVQFLLDNSRAELDAPGCPVIVTGGDASYFLSNIPGLMSAPPEFTLRGLMRIAVKVP